MNALPPDSAGRNDDTGRQGPTSQTICILAGELCGALAPEAAEPAGHGTRPRLEPGRATPDRLSAQSSAQSSAQPSAQLPRAVEDAGQTDLAHLLFDLQKQWSGRAHAQGQSFALHPAEDLPDHISGDEVLLMAALSALLHHGFSDGRNRQIVLTVTAGPDAPLVFHFRGDSADTSVDNRGGDRDSSALIQARKLCEAMGARLDLHRVLPVPHPPAARGERDARPSPHDMNSLLDIDEAVFPHLLELAGPELARDLVNRFQEDLTEVGRQIANALPKSDLAELRAASHVLIALAGTAGARQLQKDARSYNSLAHRDDSPDISGPTRKIMMQIAALIGFLGALPVTQDPKG